MNDSVSVIIPAYNEEGHIRETVHLVIKLTSKCIHDFEIVIVNDGSTDLTGKIIQSLAEFDKRIKIITHTRNRGLGRAYFTGIKNSKKKYITGYPADNDQSPDILTDLIQNRRKADLVLGYMTNLDVREWNRRILSIMFTKVMNTLFRLNLKYYNGYFICKTELLKKLKLKSIGFTMFAEVKIRLIKKGYSHLEIPYKTRRRVFGSSKALKMINILKTLYSVYMLFVDVHIKNDL